MAERSGLEMIEEILTKLNTLNKRFEVIEFNMKQLLDRANRDIKPQPEVNKPMSQVSNDGPIMKIGSNIVKPSVDLNNNLDQIRVMGKVKDKEDRMLSGIEVNILDSNGVVVKQTKTNRAGDWVSFFSPGKYKADYYLDGVSSSVDFEIKTGQKTLRLPHVRL
jgi:hypothetical protein